MLAALGALSDGLGPGGGGVAVGGGGRKSQDDFSIYFLSPTKLAAGTVPGGGLPDCLVRTLDLDRRHVCDASCLTTKTEKAMGLLVSSFLQILDPIHGGSAHATVRLVPRHGTASGRWVPCSNTASIC